MVIHKNDSEACSCESVTNLAMLVRVSITQEGNLIHDRLFMKISSDDSLRMDKSL